MKSQGACQQILHVMLQGVEGAEGQCGALRRGNMVGVGEVTLHSHLKPSGMFSS